MDKARAFIGTSGYDYPSWRGGFYPSTLPRRRWLAYLAQHVNAVELNGTFHSLKRPQYFEGLVAQTPPSFTFAVKGSRFITHMKKLRDCEAPLANFFAQGVLALGARTGPFLWQLPAHLPFDVDRAWSFLALLPRDTDEAAALARRHDARVDGRALSRPAAHVALRHAFEVRHDSWLSRPAVDLLAAFDVALVVADTAGRFPVARDVTADFAYVRLHGSSTLYASRYEDDEIARWSRRVRGWLRKVGDVHVYFDNDARGHAPFDAVRLARAVQGDGAQYPRPPPSAS